LTFVAALAAPTAAGASSGNAEKALARAALLRSGDLHGWRSTAPPKKVASLTCGAFDPVLTGIKPLGAAASPTFRQTSNGPFVAQTVDVFASPAKQRTFWHRVVTRRLEACVASSLTAGSTSDVEFKVKRRSHLPLPKIGSSASGYRVRGTATDADGSQIVYLDMIVVGRGSGVSAISFTNFFTPVARSVELRLARLVAGRLPSGTGGS
jgi:hypothetical protein